MSKTYTSISIGPIIATFSQVRKPRHLWSASYIFSHLMKIIIQQGTELGGKLISPALDKEEKTGIGLYPDRTFFEGEIDIKTLSNKVFEELENDINISANHLSDYFNLMATSIESSESESKTIGELNKKLDVLELSNRCEDRVAREKVFELILSEKRSPLYMLGFGDDNFHINTLAEIATYQIKKTHLKEWENTSKLDRLISKSFSQAKRMLLSDEDVFYASLKYQDIELKSYHKYFCVVQADGDSMGKVIGKLEDGELNELSESLIAFGKGASKEVRAFGGLPIYAGGDDLLFIAPVVSDNGNIFTLIDAIDKLYDTKVVGEKRYDTSMSYGISINYYKYPLYEVLEDARNLLFADAKEERNSIACNLRKHSGSSFKLILNKNNTDIKTAFTELIVASTEDNMVSTVAHKLRDTSVLWQSVGTDNNRLNAFFKKFMGLGEKEENKESYLVIVKNMLTLLLKQREDAIRKEVVYKMQKHIDEYNPRFYEIDSIKENVKKDVSAKYSDTLNQSLYTMLRIAKFINGEEAKDE